MTQTTIELDSRRRAGLAKLLPPDASSTYLADVSNDGVITLYPARTIAAHELRLIAHHPELIAEIRETLETGLPPAGSGPRTRP